jgi:hypothetical protein
LATIDTLQIHVKNPQPLVILYLVGLSTAAANAGIVDGDVQTPKLSHDFCDSFLDLGWATNIKVQSQNLDAGKLLLEGSVGRPQSLQVYVRQGQLGDAVFRKGESSVLPDT